VLPFYSEFGSAAQGISLSEQWIAPRKAKALEPGNRSHLLPSLAGPEIAMEYMISVAVFDPEDPITVESVTEALREYQAAVIPCASGEALHAAIAHQPVDVVVLKLEKPFEPAFSLLSEIQRKAPQAEVIFVAQFDDEIRWAWMEVIQRGAYEFLPKPFDQGDLKHYVVSAVEKHHPVEQRKRPRAESVKHLNATSTNRASAAGA